MKTTTATDTQNSLKEVSSGRPQPIRTPSPSKAHAPAWLPFKTAPAPHRCCPAAGQTASTKPVTAQRSQAAEKPEPTPKAGQSCRTLTLTGIESTPGDFIEPLIFLVLTGTSILCMSQNASSTVGWINSLPQFVEFLGGLLG